MNLLPSFTGRTVAPGGMRLIQQTEGGYDAAVSSWVARGGVASASTLDAMNAFVLGCKTDGIWDLLSRVNLFCGTALASCQIPLVNTLGGTADASTGFAGGDYAEATGLTGGSGKFFDTGLTPNSATGGLGVYVRTAATTASTRAIIGCQDVGGTQLYRMRQATTPATVSSWGGTTATSVATAMDPAFWHSTRSGSTSLIQYRNGVSSNTAAGATTPSSPGFSIYVMGYNNAGTMANLFTGIAAGYVIDAGLNATQALALYNRIQAFNTALGRNV